MNILIKNTNAMAKAYNGGQKREPDQIESVTEVPVRTVYQQNSYTERETTMLSMEQAQKQAASQMPPRRVLLLCTDTAECCRGQRRVPDW